MSKETERACWIIACGPHPAPELQHTRALACRHPRGEACLSACPAPPARSLAVSVLGSVWTVFVVEPLIGVMKVQSAQ